MFLIDTDIIIYSLKGMTAVNENMMANAQAPKAISVITYGELRYGAAKSQQRAKNLAIVKRIAELFPVVELNIGIMDIFGELKADLQRKGTVIDDFDLVNASTAMYLNYTIVTNNESHYKPVSGLNVQNWTKK
jgi:tRNA(fMet)-specific endonuclease VapC